jgi:GT2 family glycosyltransferase
MMSENKLRVALVIPTYNRDDILIDTLKGVFSQNPPADEVLVIDQSEEHSSEVQSQLDTWHKEGGIHYLYQSPPNLPSARNRALTETTCDVVIFIDDDVNLDPGFVEAHRKNYIDNQKVVAVAGRVVQRLGWPNKKRPAQWPRVMDYRYLRMDAELRREGIGTFTGGNHSVRVEYAQKLGGYDEAYQGVALREESDLALRIYSAGGVIVFDPTASLFHLAAPSGGCRRNNILDISGGLSVMRFAIKHRSVLRESFYQELWHSIRLSILTKTNLIRFWLLPIVSFHFFLATLAMFKQHKKL